jgi:dolichol kinase
MKRSAEAKMTFLGGLPVRLHFRNDLHLARKAWHMGRGLFIVLCYMLGTPQSNAILILGFFLGLDLFLENLRLRSSVFNDKIMRFMGPFMRAHEIKQMSTVPHYLSSVILAIAIFPRPIATLSILYLACGDPIASLFGILYGHKGPKISANKTLIGTSAGIFVCAFVTYFYLNTLSFSNSNILVMSVVGGLAGGLAELLPFEVDDNFTIPIISGFVLWLAFMVMGI